MLDIAEWSLVGGFYKRGVVIEPGVAMSLGPSSTDLRIVVQKSHAPGDSKDCNGSLAVINATLPLADFSARLRRGNDACNRRAERLMNDNVGTCKMSEVQPIASAPSHRRNQTTDNPQATTSNTPAPAANNALTSTSFRSNANRLLNRR